MVGKFHLVQVSKQVVVDTRFHPVVLFLVH